MYCYNPNKSDYENYERVALALNLMAQELANRNNLFSKTFTDAFVIEYLDKADKYIAKDGPICPPLKIKEGR